MDSIDMSVEPPLDLDAFFAGARTPPAPWPSAARLDTTMITRRARSSPNSGPAVVVLGLLAIVMSALAVRASTATWRVAPEPHANVAAAVAARTATPRPTRDAAEREAVAPAERRFPDLEAERRHVVEVYLFRQALLAKLRGQ